MCAGTDTVTYAARVAERFVRLDNLAKRHMLSYLDFDRKFLRCSPM